MQSNVNPIDIQRIPYIYDYKLISWICKPNKSMSINSKKLFVINIKCKIVYLKIVEINNFPV
jgi:hypothetical protein